MVVENAKKVFEIHVEECAVWEKRPHKHNFFELVYVEHGRGYQCINEHEFAYDVGNIFLLPPMDCHTFKIESPSCFYFVRFTDHYFLKSDKLTGYKDWFDKMAYILANYNKVPGDIIGSNRERAYIIQTIKSVYQEYLLADAYSDAIISGAMASIINILARSIEKQYVHGGDYTDDKFGEVLRYIHQYILEPENLRIPHLSAHFGIAATYFSEYFKKQAGTSLAAYIVQSKLKLAETKILHTSLTVKEIAYQLNFTDSSHLARTFKQAYGMTIKDFRTKGQPRCAR